MHVHNAHDLWYAIFLPFSPIALPMNFPLQPSAGAEHHNFFNHDFPAFSSSIYLAARTTWLVEYAHVADGAVVDTPLGEVEVHGTPLDSGTTETMMQAIAGHIPEDQKDENHD